jgi:hypothetical protein
LVFGLGRGFFGLEEKEVLRPVDFVFGFLENNISKECTELFLAERNAFEFLKLLRGIKVNNGSALEEEFDGCFEEELIIVGFGGFLDGLGGGKFPGDERDVTLR